MSGPRFDGGENERLAPVTPLFGGSRDQPAGASSFDDETADSERRWHTTWVDDARSKSVEAGEERRAPLLRPAFSGQERDGDASSSRESSSRGATTSAESAADRRARAETLLVKRLRGRSLSVREARAVLAESGVEHPDDEDIIAAFLDNGYLDDLRLAEQLLDGALGRKAQGRSAVAQTLSRRGLERDVIDIALASLPDDEAERALEFARHRARTMDGLAPDVALRRLHGQLARRGFGGPVAMSAARQALDESR